MAHGVVDAAIIGGGIIGASIAERIQCSEPSWRCVIFEAEEAPGTGETRWATGGVRHQFGTEPNIRLSLISVPVFENFPDEYGIDPAFRRHGYLFVTADEKRLALMDRERELQNSLGVPTQRLDREQLRKHCPPLFVDDLLGGNFCALDGSIEPAWVLQGYIDNFRRHGGSLATAAPVVEIEHTGTTWRLTTPRATYDTPIVVIACGPHTRAVAALAKLDVPVQPYARQVFVAQALPAIPPVIPLTIDIDTGWYIHAHHAELLLGGTDKETRPLDGATADVDWTAFETVYHAATHRMPALAEANILHAYAGARTLTPDHHPILGPVETHPGIYLACGLSGHGIMHAPAVGILLAEWITEGRPRTWDARPLTIARFGKPRPLAETAVF